ncbi:MAG: HlyD family type I secretion periplasmic adaptor subunit [Alphaproteobacteria bacterium]
MTRSEMTPHGTRPSNGSLLAPVSDARGTPRVQFRYLSHSVRLEEAGPPRILLAFIAVVALLLAGAVGWASVTPVTTAARTAGTIMPSGAIRSVQHLEGGIAQELLVRNGDAVAAGDILVRLDSAASGADLEQLESRYIHLRAKAMRLRAEINGGSEQFDSIAVDNLELAEDQRRLLESARQSYVAEQTVLRDRLRQSELEVEALRVQISSLTEQITYMDDQRKIREDLFNKGVGSRISMLEIQREFARLRGRLGEVRSSLRLAESAVVEARNQILEHAINWRNDRAQELETVSSELTELRESLARYRDRFARLNVLAPVSGTVNALSLSGPGAVISAGQTLMDIVPGDETLVVEARVDPRDVGYLRRGQLVNVAVSGFDVSRYGTLSGQLERVSATSFADDEGRIYYEARVVLAENELGPSIDRRRVLPGMTVEANINTGSRSLLEFLVRPVSASLRYAFAER